MPKNEKPDGFQPIEYTPGAQNPPVVSEVDFSTPAPQEPDTKTHPAPSLTKPQTAAQIKED